MTDKHLVGLLNSVNSMLFKNLNVDNDALHFHTGSFKITIFKVYSFGSQKRLGLLCVRF